MQGPVTAGRRPGAVRPGCGVANMAAPVTGSRMDEQAGGAAALGILAVVIAAGTVAFLTRSGAASVWIALCAACVAFLAAAVVLAAVETSHR